MNNKLDKITRMFPIIIMLLLSCVLMAAPVSAEDAGDGSGGGQGVPLGLASSTPADGSKNVALGGDIKLTFNKNVIYLGIRENNQKCFSLVATDGSKVPIDVIMADDQIHPEEKRNVSIHPLQELKPGTAYALKISPDLQAKNGDILEHEVTVDFVTAGMAAKPMPVASSNETVKSNKETKPELVIEKSEVKNETTTPVDSEKSAVVEEKETSVVEKNQVAQDKTKQLEDKQVNNEEKTPVKENNQDKQKPNRTYAIIAGLILIAGVGYLAVRRKHK
ncbi:MAG: Ig-like domain-containing protein [Syntrophomonas sp.]